MEQCGLLEKSCCNSVEMTSSSEILLETDTCNEFPLDKICVPEGIRLPKESKFIKKVRIDFTQEVGWPTLASRIESKMHKLDST